MRRMREAKQRLYVSRAPVWALASRFAHAVVPDLDTEAAGERFEAPLRHHDEPPVGNPPPPSRTAQKAQRADTGRGWRLRTKG